MLLTPCTWVEDGADPCTWVEDGADPCTWVEDGADHSTWVEDGADQHGTDPPVEAERSFLLPEWAAHGVEAVVLHLPCRV
jgi:hypothetical protein